MTAVTLGRDKLPFDLLCSRKGFHVAGDMCHEMLLALPTSHVDTNNGLWPRDGIAEFPHSLHQSPGLQIGLSAA